ncbi:MAG: lanthionine synthetase LanC family protein, partial [Balneolaceae bacterium]
MIDIPSKNKLLKKAESIGNELLKVADRLNDGSITWGRGADLNLQPVYDSGIFNGRCGEGLFFGALYNATNDRKFKKASIQCFRGLQKNLGNAGYRENLIQRLGLGLAGVGGILYSLVRTSEFIGEYSMVKDAENVTASVTATHIKKDNLLEIIRGTAGLIPGLLALSDKGCEQALRTARICGSHLLERRVTDPVTKRKAWAVQRYIPESGFAHGSSGIAHSLQQLYKRIGELRFYDATMEAFSFEQSIFRENDLNWPDFRNQKKIKMCSWCRGATGIGFSRLSALDIIKEPDESNIAMDLMNALNKT